jgi:hypothetical protein
MLQFVETGVIGICEERPHLNGILTVPSSARPASHGQGSPFLRQGNKYRERREWIKVFGLQTGILRGKNLHSMGRDILNSNRVNEGRPCNNYESRKGDFFAGVFPPFFKRMAIICCGLHLFLSLVLALRTTFTFLINYKTDRRIVNLVVIFAGTKKRSERALFVEVEV